MLARFLKKQSFDLRVSTTEEALDAILKATIDQQIPTKSSLRTTQDLVLKFTVEDWQSAGLTLNKLIMLEQAAFGINLLKETNLLKLLIPELAAAQGIKQGGFHHLDVLDHSIEALRQLIGRFPDSSLELRWASLLHDVGKAPTYQNNDGQLSFLAHDKVGAELSLSLLKRFGWSSEQASYVAQLVQYHMLPLPKNKKAAERFARKRAKLLPDLLNVMIADREAAQGRLSTEASRTRYRLAIARILEAMQEPEAELPILLNGQEVMSFLNLPAGPKVGEALGFIRAAQEAGDIKSTEDAKAAVLHYATKRNWLMTRTK